MDQRGFGIGGDFFPPQWKVPLLREHLLTLSDMARPKVCYVGSATGDNAQNIATFYQEFGRHNTETSHLSLYSPPLVFLNKGSWCKASLWSQET